MKYVILITLVFVLSCASKKDKDAGKQNPGNTNSKIDSLTGKPTQNDSLRVLETGDSASLVYDEGTMTLSFSFVDAGDKKNIIPIGKYHNTFGQPPHETKLISSAANRGQVFALIFTNLVQMGISTDNAYVFKLDKKAKTASEVCRFEDIAHYSDKSGIDTLSDINQYDYEIGRKETGDKIQLILYEYLPYRYEDETRNKGHWYKTKKRECIF